MVKKIFGLAFLLILLDSSLLTASDKDRSEKSSKEKTCLKLADEFRSVCLVREKSRIVREETLYVFLSASQKSKNSAEKKLANAYCVWEKSKQKAVTRERELNMFLVKTGKCTAAESGEIQRLIENSIVEETPDNKVILTEFGKCKERRRKEAWQADFSLIQP